MTGPACGPDDHARDPDTRPRAGRVRHAGTALSAAALATQPAGCPEVTASTRQPGRTPAEVIAGEDGHAGIHWRSSPDATPRQTADAITSALAGAAQPAPRPP